MTQIINDKLKKLCDNCRCDKSCAWISLGNEYCDDIMELQKEIERLNNIIDELENWLKTIPNYFMDARSLNSGIEKQNGMKYIIDLSLEKLKELKGDDEDENN